MGKLAVSARHDPSLRAPRRPTPNARVVRPGSPAASSAASDGQRRRQGEIAQSPGATGPHPRRRRASAQLAAGGQPQPGQRVGLDDVGRRSPGVARARDGLHGDERGTRSSTERPGACAARSSASAGPRRPELAVQRDRLARGRLRERSSACTTASTGPPGRRRRSARGRDRPTRTARRGRTGWRRPSRAAPRRARARPHPGRRSRRARTRAGRPAPPRAHRFDRADRSDPHLPGRGGVLRRSPMRPTRVRMLDGV